LEPVADPEFGCGGYTKNKKNFNPIEGFYFPHSPVDLTYMAWPLIGSLRLF